jgi:hypothetical protein
MYTTCLIALKLCILLSECIYVIHMILKVNGDYIRK